MRGLEGKDRVCGWQSVRAARCSWTGFVQLVEVEACSVCRLLYLRALSTRCFASATCVNLASFFQLGRCVHAR